ncbi:unnamed protein product [Pedinophyceae sp. YPF-701]|nr:unnamed protein product [Pedinophyceae sp. YPF-701]
MTQEAVLAKAEAPDTRLISQDAMAAAKEQLAEEKPVPHMEPVTGRIHSLDSFSAIDGPGLRYMMFLQGCGMRCKFCSNPDTWLLHEGLETDSAAIGEKIKSVEPYLRRGGGGVTLSGGEPLLQPRFAAAILKEAHALGLHTAIDTTGQGTKHRHWDVVLPHVDLVMLCTKSPKPDVYASLTGHDQRGMLRFAKEVAVRGIPLWLRYVMIPGMTDSDYDAEWLIKFARAHPTFEKVDLLPYHKLGVNKWEAMGMPYPLEGQRSPSHDEAKAFAQKLRDAGLSVIVNA